MGISLLHNGNEAFLPMRCENLLSEGFTASAISPSSVSGLVVATVTNLSVASS